MKSFVDVTITNIYDIRRYLTGLQSVFIDEFISSVPAANKPFIVTRDFVKRPDLISRILYNNNPEHWKFLLLFNRLSSTDDIIEAMELKYYLEADFINFIQALESGNI